MLRLSEEILILALNEKTGLFEPLPDRALDFALAGAALMELVYANRTNKNISSLHITNSAPTGEPFEDYVLDLLIHSNPDEKLVNKLHLIASSADHIKSMLLNNFLELGIFTREYETFLGIHFKTKYYLEKPELKERIVNRLKAILFQGKPEFDRDCVLLSLISATKIYRNAFTQEEIEKARPILESLRKQDSDPLAQEIWIAINEIQDALDMVIASSV